MSTHGDCYDGAPLEGLVGCLQECIFSGAVQSTCCFVEDQTGRSPQNGTCQAQQLSVSCAQVNAPITQHSICKKKTSY